MNKQWDFSPSREMDVICMGRVAVDLYSEQIGCSIEETETFRKYLGGCAGNIAVGTSRLGLKSAMFSCVGADAMGNFLTATLQQENVNISLLKKTQRHLTGLVILGIDPPDRFPLIFYRENCADMQLSSKDIDKTFFAKAKSLLITGTGLSTESMRSATHHAIETAIAVGTKVIFDLDYRPVLWGVTDKGDGESRYQFSDTVSSYYQAVLKKCDLIVGTEEEILIASGQTTVEESVIKIRSHSSAPIVLKRGAKGCCIYFDDLSNPLVSKPFPVKILNVLGAGDAFMSGLLRGLLCNESWSLSADYANACGAIVVTRHGCAPAMPHFPEMQKFIEGYENVTLSDT